MHLLFTAEDGDGCGDGWVGVLEAGARGPQLFNILLKQNDGSIVTKCFSNNEIQAVVTLIRVLPYSEVVQ